MEIQSLIHSKPGWVTGVIPMDCLNVFRSVSNTQTMLCFLGIRKVTPSDGRLWSAALGKENFAANREKVFVGNSRLEKKIADKVWIGGDPASLFLTGVCHFNRNEIDDVVDVISSREFIPNGTIILSEDRNPNYLRLIESYHELIQAMSNRANSEESFALKEINIHNKLAIIVDQVVDNLSGLLLPVRTILEEFGLMYLVKEGIGFEETSVDGWNYRI